MNPNGTVGKIKFADWRAHKVIDDIALLLVDLCLLADDHEVEHNKWLMAINSFQVCITVCCCILLSYNITFDVLIYFCNYFNPFFRPCSRSQIFLMSILIAFKAMLMTFSINGSI